MEMPSAMRMTLRHSDTARTVSTVSTASTEPVAVAPAADATGAHADFNTVF
jgi:hypothetical protein